MKEGQQCGWFAMLFDWADTLVRQNLEKTRAMFGECPLVINSWLEIRLQSQCEAFKIQNFHIHILFQTVEWIQFLPGAAACLQGNETNC